MGLDCVIGTSFHFCTVNFLNISNLCHDISMTKHHPQISSKNHPAIVQSTTDRLDTFYTNPTILCTHLNVQFHCPCVWKNGSCSAAYFSVTWDDVGTFAGRKYQRPVLCSLSKNVSVCILPGVLCSAGPVKLQPLECACGVNTHKTFTEIYLEACVI